MKTHAILVNPAFELQDGTLAPGARTFDFPLGLGMVGTALIQHGYTAEIINANVHPDWQMRIMKSVSQHEDELAFVGFSCMSSQVRSALRVSKALKAYNDRLPIVFGGVHPTLLPESLVCTPWVDYAVINEGDKAAVGLMDHLNGNLPIRLVHNVMDGTQRATFVKSSSMPERVHPSLYERDMDRYVMHVNGRRGFSILTGLGCNYNCAFCINGITRRHYRSRSSGSIHREVRELKRKHGITFFNFQDEHFFGDRRRLMTWLDLVENDSELMGQIAWNSTIRVSDLRPGYVDVELLKRIGRCGGDGFGVGGESGSNRVLKLLRKGIDRLDILQAVGIANTAKVHLDLSFVALWPTETKEELEQTCKLCSQIIESGPYAAIPYFQTYRPYPGSIWEKDLSPYADPENIPDSMWRYQRIEDIVDRHTYRLVSSTQLLCATGRLRWQSQWLVKNLLGNLLHRLCRWRIEHLNFRWYCESPIIRFIRKYYLKQL